MIAVRRISHATLETPDLDRQIDYYVDVVGLMPLARSKDQAVFASRLGHLALVLNRGSAARLTRLTFQVAPQSDLGEMAKFLASQGIAAELRHDALPGLGPVLTFADPKGTLIDVFAEARPNAASQPAGVAPFKLGHVSYQLSDIHPLIDFYQRILGFRISDWQEDFFVFMRCGSDHHTINFATGKSSRMHHMAFELKDWSHVLNACDHLGLSNIPIIWGPGRHGISHNIFTYHCNPDDLMVEFYARWTRCWTRTSATSSRALTTRTIRNGLRDRKSAALMWARRRARSYNGWNRRETSARRAVACLHQRRHRPNIPSAPSTSPSPTPAAASTCCCGRSAKATQSISSGHGVEPHWRWWRHRRYVARATPDGCRLRAGAGLFCAAGDAAQRRLHHEIPASARLREPDGADHVKTSRDLVERARVKPLNYAATAPGTITHLAAAALAVTANVPLEHVPFRGDGELMGQLIGGHVDFAVTTLASAMAAGPSVRVVAIFADARNSSAPDIPTVKEQGYDVAPTSFGGLFAPAGVPADVIAKLGTGCKFAIEQPAYVELAKRFHQGSRYYADAATFAKRLEQDIEDKGQLLKRLGLPK